MSLFHYYIKSQTVMSVLSVDFTITILKVISTMILISYIRN